MPEYILAVDLGTTALKLAAIDHSLRIVAAVSQPYAVSFPHAGWAEQDPQMWWAALKTAIKKLKHEVPELSSTCSSLVFAAQMCGVVPVDEHGEALRPCMIWLDKRAGKLIREQMSGFPKLFGYGAAKLLTSIRLANGAPSLNGMDPPAKMLWIQKNEPEIWQKTHKLLDVKDWMLHQCTGKFVTTADSANLTWMMDTRPKREGWSETLIKRYNMRVELLPEIVDGTAIVGRLTLKKAKELGLREGVAVIAGCGDVCASALGSGATADGELHISMGTSAWIGGFFAGRRLSASESYATILSPFNNRPLLIATQECAATNLDWLANIIGKDIPISEVSNVELPMFLPWLAGERVPIDDNRLRGGFLGLSLSHNKHALYMAVVEGIALNLRWAMRSVSKQKGVLKGHSLPLVGGGANNAVLCQALADCLNIDLTTMANPQYSGVLGAAAIAATALGHFENVWQASASLGKMHSRKYSANPERQSYYDKRFKLFLEAFRNNASWFRKAYPGFEN